jgi:polyisoprenoid-binding protein YceI
MIDPARLARPLAWLALLAAAAGPLGAETEAYTVDPATSHVRIHLGRAGLMKFLGHDHEIEAPVAEGRIEVVDGEPTRSSVVLRFESARLSLVPGSEPASDIPKVEERMRGPQVLEVTRHPKIAFVSTSVRLQAQDGPRVKIVVAGTLTLRGRALALEVPLEVLREAGQIVARGGLALSLRGLGIEPPSVAGVVNVADRFGLEFEIRTTAPRPR